MANAGRPDRNRQYQIIDRDLPWLVKFHFALKEFLRVYILEEYAFPKMFYPTMLVGLLLWSIIFSVLVKIVDPRYDQEFLRGIYLEYSIF